MKLYHYLVSVAFLAVIMSGSALAMPLQNDVMIQAIAASFEEPAHIDAETFAYKGDTLAVQEVGQKAASSTALSLAWYRSVESSQAHSVSGSAPYQVIHSGSSPGMYHLSLPEV